MSSVFGRWLAYGLGAAAGRAIFGDGEGARRPPAAPIRQQTEAEILEAERRYDEDARRLEAEDRARRTAARRRR